MIAFHLAGKPQVAIVRALQHLNVNKSFVSRSTTRYRNTGSITSHLKMDEKKKTKTTT